MDRELLAALEVQVERLRTLGYPHELGGEDRFHAAVARARHVVGTREEKRPAASDTSLLLVVSEFAVSLSWQIGRVEIDRKNGQTFLDTGPVRPVEGVSIPDLPVYPLFGVQAGHERGEATIGECLHALTAARRRPLASTETTALLIHFPELFSAGRSHELLALASPSGSHVPVWYLDGNRPTLGCCLLSKEARCSNRSIPSCELD